VKAISLGWGVQSFTLAAMSALGELERVDAAVHADTRHERLSTYDFAARWAPWLEAHGVKVVTVCEPGTDPVNNGYGGVDIPAYLMGKRGKGQIRRQCTSDWKIAPLRRWLQSNREKRPVELWIGISLDEYQRMKPSNRQYITHRWPLIERRMTREDCKAWLAGHGLEIPDKSSCVFCPYHAADDWRDLRSAGGDDWSRAVVIDESIRLARSGVQLYLHRSCVPLPAVDLVSPGAGQLSLWSEECSGMCGV
jgi:hypothetical protein